jgi:8-oxo-dGTP diphosphatase
MVRPGMIIPEGLFKILKEILRHLLRRPVVGISAVATLADGRVLLIRRGDTGQWALPGGTLEWGETLRDGIVRELLEEAGVHSVRLGGLLGVYSAPQRDPRFHAVTVVVRAEIEEPTQGPSNPTEILEVGLFQRDHLPQHLSHGNKDMLTRALSQETFWE